MRILSLITARGGSKRLPGKNIRLLGGKPLLVWSIDAAIGIPEICDVLVSTDDPVIADIALKAGAMVPWLRPADLATDTATSESVALHALDWYENNKGKIDGLLLLQPTTPFRNIETTRKGIALFQQNGQRPVVGVSPAKSHPFRCFKIEDNTLSPFIAGAGVSVRSQELPPAYAVNGAFYLIAPKDLRESVSFYSKNMIPLKMEDPEESIDIDTEWDWMMAEAVFHKARE